MSRKKLKIKPYELSVWKEKINTQTDATLYTTTETRIATIGSSLMHFPGAAKNIVLKRNVNGTNTLTFQLSSRYFDAPFTYPSARVPLAVQGGAQEYENNYFVELLHNEARLKLKYGDEWYDFLVKDIQEDSSNYLFTYTATDLYINELSRNGYDLEFSTALGNNMGTITELGGKVLEDLDGWSLEDCDPCPEVKEEKVFKLYSYSSNSKHTSRAISYIKQYCDAGSSPCTWKALQGELPTNPNDYKVFFEETSGQETKTYFYTYYSSTLPADFYPIQAIAVTKNKSGDFKLEIDEETRKVTNGIPVLLVAEKTINEKKQYFPYCIEIKHDSTLYPNSSPVDPHCVADRPVLTIESKYDPDLDTVVVKMGDIFTSVVNANLYLNYQIPNPIGNPIWFYEKTHFQDPFPINKLAANENFIDQGGEVSGWSSAKDALTNSGMMSIEKQDSKNLLKLTKNSTYYNKNVSLLPTELKIDDYYLLFFKGEKNSMLGLANNFYFSNTGETITLDKTRLALEDTDPNPHQIMNFLPAGAFWYMVDNNKNTLFEQENFTLKNAVRNLIENNYFKFNDTDVNNNGIEYSPPIPVVGNRDLESYVKYLLSPKETDKAIIYFFGRINPDMVSDIKKYISNLQFRLNLTNNAAWDLRIEKMELFKSTYLINSAIDSNYGSIGNNIWSWEKQWCFPNQIEKIAGSGDTTSNLGADWSYKSYHCIYYLTKGDKKIPVELCQTLKKPQPFYRAESERVTSIEIKESNRFNILQELAEKFQMWPKFTITHGTDGTIKGKTISFKQSLEPDTHPLGFKYGVNLKQIQRTVNSDQLSSFVIVLPNNNEFAQNGFCTIARASQNPSGEQYIINFDYYIQMGMLDRDQTYGDLYVNDCPSFNKPGDGGNDVITGKYIGLYPRMAWYNRQIDYLSGDASRQSDFITTIQSSMNSIKQTVNGYYSKIQDIEKKIYALFGLSSFEGTVIDLEVNDLMGFLNAFSSRGGSRFNDFINNIKNNAVGYLFKEASKNIIVAQKELLEDATVLYEKWQDSLDSYNKLYPKFSKATGNLLELEGHIEYYINQKKELLKTFRKKYGRFIQEGTWQDENYIDDNQYYLDALSVAYTSSRPQISYNISAIDVSPISGYEQYDIKLGQLTTIEDPKFFGYDSNGNPKKEQVFISETSECLDSPDKNEFVIQNYRTQWEDLFQRISAAVQSLQYSEAAYKKSAGIVNPFGEIKVSCLEETIKNNNLTLKNAGNQSVEWDDKGITVSSKWKSSNIVRIVNDGIYVSSDGGDNFVNAVSAEGISASLLTAGTVNTEEIIISANGAPSFHWDKKGISAYWFEGTPEIFDYSKFVRFDRYGLYGIENGTVDWQPASIEDITEKSLFSLTWAGLNIKTATEGVGYSFGTDSGFTMYKADEKFPLITLSAFYDENTDDLVYALKGRDNSIICYTDKFEKDSNYFLNSILITPQSQGEMKISIYTEEDKYALPTYKTYGNINLYQGSINPSQEVVEDEEDEIPVSLENHYPTTTLNPNGTAGFGLVVSNFNQGLQGIPAISNTALYGFAHLGTSLSFYGGKKLNFTLHSGENYILPTNFVAACGFNTTAWLKLAQDFSDRTTQDICTDNITTLSAFGNGFGGQHLDNNRDQSFISFNGTSENEIYLYGLINHIRTSESNRLGEYSFYSAPDANSPNLELSRLRGAELVIQTNDGAKVSTLTPEKLNSNQVETETLIFGGGQIRVFNEITGENRVGFFWD